MLICKTLQTKNIPQKLYDMGHRTYFKKDDIIFRQGDIIDYLYILVKGKVISYSENEDGSLYYANLLVSHCIFAEQNAITKNEMHLTFKCIEDCEVIKIDRNILIDTMKVDFDISYFLYNINTENFLRLSLLFNKYFEYSCGDRIIKMFVEFVEVFGVKVNNKIKIDYSFNQQFISDLANVKRSTTVRTIRKLKEKKIIEYYRGKYYVTDVDLLNETILQKEFSLKRQSSLEKLFKDN